MAVSFQDLTNALRFLSIDVIEQAGSGHPGLPLGMADVATVLFRDFFVFDPEDPQWPERDRFILSAGHGSMLLYSLLYLTGYERPTLEDLKKFRQLGSLTHGHPEYGFLPGVETTTGPLGQGLATAVGLSLAERMTQARVGGDSHYTYVLVSDGDLMEGISHEAITLAGHLKLSKLIVLFDSNQITIDGSTSLSTSENTLLRFQAAGWSTLSINAHAEGEIGQGIQKAQTSDRPTLILCNSIIGKGSPHKQGTSACHGSPLGKEEAAATREALGWPHEPFEVPEEILKEWRSFAHKRVHQRSHREALPKTILEPSLFEGIKKELEALKPNWATRQISHFVLEKLIPQIPELIGGSADLTPSTGTFVKGMKSITPGSYGGRYIHYGIREHAMAAVMNGLSLYGPWIPYGGTFLVFSDYLRPALRLSALMQQGVIYVLTHDSIGLGEDGPTHQPVEHLASLRAMPNVNVFRPGDVYEVVECWELALLNRQTPSVLSLSRQNVPVLRETPPTENLCAKGGYIFKDASQTPEVTLIATGSEVGLAVEVQELLGAKNIHAQVASLPCLELFDQQPKDYKQSVLGQGLRVGIEAACSFGWDKYLGENGLFFGMSTFGASGKAQDLYEHFGLTPVSIAQKIEETLCA